MNYLIKVLTATSVTVSALSKENNWMHPKLKVSMSDFDQTTFTNKVDHFASSDDANYGKTYE